MATSGMSHGSFFRNWLSPSVTPSQLFFAVFEQLAGTQGVSRQRQAILNGLFRRLLTPAEAQFVIKIVTGDLRIGLKESTVEDAIAKAFEQPAGLVRRTNMSLGDIGETAVLARQGKLDASIAVVSPDQIHAGHAGRDRGGDLRDFCGPFYVEDKYDGIRGQLHVDASVRRCSREPWMMFPRNSRKLGRTRET